jgi:hypothetical protein
MAGPLFEQLKKLDLDLANEYAEVTNDKATIDVTGVRRLFKKILEAEYITTKEAEGLVLLIDSGTLTADALQLLKNSLLSKAGVEAIVNGAGNAVILDKDSAELTGFYRSLDLGIPPKMKFWSKGTNFTYTAAHFQAVKQLVKQGNVKVVKVFDGRLYANAKIKGPSAAYSPEMNLFFFFQPPTGTNFFSNAPEVIAHEATHAIQDWFNLSTTYGFGETDGVLVQSVAYAGRGNKLKEVYDKAVNLILQDKAIRGNRAWETAYDNAMADVVRDPLYAPSKDVRWSGLIETDGSDEPAKMRQALEDAVKKAPGKRTTPRRK